MEYSPIGPFAQAQKASRRIVHPGYGMNPSSILNPREIPTGTTLSFSLINWDEQF